MSSSSDPATLERSRQAVARQQCPGVRSQLLAPAEIQRHVLMAEIVLDGRASSMDIGALSLGRFGAAAPRAEANMF
ncbi:MAG: hypothetical protein HYV93_13605 [Candidatus Rokubacteria bacterium]|nr:hypothetical protein [Candidatus Rokubacteria bacterium]